jgi:hypothetical protein
MLDNALDWGITEEQFWNMTIGELDRLVSSCRRVEKHRLKERATMDYTLALIIGKAVRGADEEHPFPGLYEVYPDLFREEAIKKAKDEEEQQAQLSAIRFIQFAESFNSKFYEEANE